MSTAVSVRLPENLAKELDHIAEETERPRSFHVQKALETYIEDFADVQIALDRLRDQLPQHAYFDVVELVDLQAALAGLVLPQPLEQGLMPVQRVSEI